MDTNPIIDMLGRRLRLAGERRDQVAHPVRPAVDPLGREQARDVPPDPVLVPRESRDQHEVHEVPFQPIPHASPRASLTRSMKSPRKRQKP